MQAWISVVRRSDVHAPHRHGPVRLGAICHRMVWPGRGVRLRANGMGMGADWMGSTSCISIAVLISLMECTGGRVQIHLFGGFGLSTLGRGPNSDF